jgi:hypothetical protein
MSARLSLKSGVDVTPDRLHQFTLEPRRDESLQGMATWVGIKAWKLSDPVT